MSIRQISRRISALAGAGLLIVVLLVTPKVSAAQITARKVTLSSSAASASATYTFNFTVPSSTVLKSFKAEACTTASGTCTTPTGFAGGSSTLSSQPTNYGDASGWTVDSNAGNLRFKKTANSAAPTGSQTVVFGSVTNPSTTNQTFYMRLTTYSDDAYTTAVDTGVVAASTATAIQLSGTMDESLVFCTGTSITGTNCGTASGSSVNFGTFSSTSTSTGTSVMAASTNGQTGYAITVNGATLTSGANTITAVSSPTASSTGSSQFGLNIRDNATPNIGSDPSGASGTSYGSGYGTADSYKFVTGDTVASRTNQGDATAFTVSYIVNVPGSQPAGAYTATMTYICTATF